METAVPSIHRANFLAVLGEEIRLIGEDHEVSPQEAYARLVLATLGYEFVEDQYSDGGREYGIDYWDSSEESSVIFQFKSAVFSDGIDASRKVLPSHLTDLPRIQKILAGLDAETPIANSSVAAFLDRLRHNIRRHYENPTRQNEPYEVSIYLAVLASSFTEQAQVEFDKQCEDSQIQVEVGEIRLCYNPILIDDLISEKWRRTNTEWKDINEKKRDFIKLTVCHAQLIGEPKSCMFFTRAIDLVEAYQSFGYQIFEPNVRCEVPRSEVNKQIQASVLSSRGRKEFRHLNNGITMICAGFTKPTSPGQIITVTEPGIINGLQTVKSIADAYRELEQAERIDFEEKCSVMVRLHMRNAVADYRDLVKSTNNQNPMQPRNLRSNDPEQVGFERLFANLDWFYERKQGAWQAFKSNPRLWRTLPHKKASEFQISGRRYRTVDNEQLAQCWLAFLGYSFESVHNMKDIFQTDDMYEFIFLSRPAKHGCDFEFEFNPKKMGVAIFREAPPPDLMLISWLLRESLRKLVPTSQANREEACQRLKLNGKPSEEQDMELVKDDKYLRNLIMRAWSFLFVEFVGLILFRSFGENVYAIGNRLLQNRSMMSLFREQNFEILKEILDEERFEDDDFLAIIWNLFVHLAENLVASPWLESWKQARVRTRFNYSVDTRKRLRHELEQVDLFLRKSQLTRPWAVGLNNSKGVFAFAKDCLYKSP